MGTEANLSAPSFDAQVTLAKRAIAEAKAAGDDDGAAAATKELAKLTGRKEPGADPVERAVKKAPEKATTPRKRATAAKRK